MKTELHTYQHFYLDKTDNYTTVLSRAASITDAHKMVYAYIGNERRAVSSDEVQLSLLSSASAGIYNVKTHRMLMPIDRSCILLQPQLVAYLTDDEAEAISHVVDAIITGMV